MVNTPVNLTIIKHFGSLEDPRVLRTQRHPLVSIIVLAIAGILCGAESWVEIEEFGNTKELFFKTFLSLPNGIPSHDTFGRVFAVLDASAFRDKFIAWVQELISPNNQGKSIAIDGKTVRRSHHHGIGKEAIHMVSAWVQENRLVLGQINTNTKSNEITAIPQLLNLLILEDCIVSIDAIGCQKKIIKAIVAKKADYVIAVKENQPMLYESVKDSFPKQNDNDNLSLSVAETYETIEKGHGRIETRKYSLITNSEYLDYANPDKLWGNLNGIGMVESERIINNISSKERRFYITSLKKVNDFAQSVRNHWGIENSLHWVLDVAFHEDQCRVRSGYADQNFSVLRHIALNLIRKHQGKGSVKTKRLKSGWDNNYLMEVLKSSFI